MEKFTAYGTPDEIISQAERMFRSGVARVSFNHPHGANVHEALEEIGTKILPYFNPENGRTG